MFFLLLLLLLQYLICTCAEPIPHISPDLAFSETVRKIKSRKEETCLQISPMQKLSSLRTLVYTASPATKEKKEKEKRKEGGRHVLNYRKEQIWVSFDSAT